MITLKPHQKEALEALEREVAKGSPQKLTVCIATGGGKTVLAVEFIGRHILSRGKRVLWVTKDWQLLKQMSRTLRSMYPQYAYHLGRVGGDADLAEVSENHRAGVVLTTIHTYRSRQDDEFRRQAFDFVFIDEVHWGEGAPMYEELDDHFGKRAIFIGLTATPRKWSEHRLVCNLGFAELVRREELAKPIPVVVGTNFKWTPELSSAHGDWTATSMKPLASSKDRNRLVVQHYITNRGRYGKTIVFAIDIAHAEKLAKLFRDSNVGCSIVHNDYDKDENEYAKRAFEINQVEVLVNVAKMTHGVDIPDIKTVFLARPTASDILFAQMVGRGSRLHEPSGKKDFFVVDFEDNLTEHGSLLKKATSLFGNDERPENRTTIVSTTAVPFTASRLSVPGAIRLDPTSPRAVRDVLTSRGSVSGNGFTIWLTGLPLSGKHAAARAVAEKLRRIGKHVELLDADEWKVSGGRSLTSTKAERDDSARRAGLHARMVTSAGGFAVVPHVSPYREVRDELRRDIGRFLEVFIDAPIEALIARDTKGEYQRAIRGEIRNFIGITDPYEPPANPEVKVDSSKVSPDDTAVLVLEALVKEGGLGPSEIGRALAAREESDQADRASSQFHQLTSTEPDKEKHIRERLESLRRFLESLPLDSSPWSPPPGIPLEGWWEAGRTEKIYLTVFRDDATELATRVDELRKRLSGTARLFATAPELKWISAELWGSFESAVLATGVAPRFRGIHAVDAETARTIARSTSPGVGAVMAAPSGPPVGENALESGPSLKVRLPGGDDVSLTRAQYDGLSAIWSQRGHLLPTSPDESHLSMFWMLIEPEIGQLGLEKVICQRVLSTAITAGAFPAPIDRLTLAQFASELTRMPNHLHAQEIERAYRRHFAQEYSSREEFLMALLLLR